MIAREIMVNYSTSLWSEHIKSEATKALFPLSMSWHFVKVTKITAAVF